MAWPLVEELFCGFPCQMIIFNISIRCVKIHVNMRRKISNVTNFLELTHNRATIIFLWKLGRKKLRPNMVLVWDGNSEIGSHVRSGLCYLICSSHSFSSRAVTNMNCFFRIDLFSFIRTHHILCYEWYKYVGRSELSLYQWSYLVHRALGCMSMTGTLST